MTATMRTEIDSEHGIVYLASTFEYRPAHKAEVGDVVMVEVDGVVDFDRVCDWESGTDYAGAYIKLWFEGSKTTKVYAPFDLIMLAV